MPSVSQDNDHPHALKPSDPSLQSGVSQFVASPSFPCVGAKSALNKDRIEFCEYDALGDAADAADLCHRLYSFSQAYPDPGNLPVSLMAMFRTQVAGEVAFENALWRHLGAMHEYDRRQFDWDPAVSDDPSHTDFSMSIGGRAYFVVGLHPHASRLSRRTAVPCLVFNFHNQFESLKASGKYRTLQAAIRSRDVALQGDVNPVLARFGEASEARQYSGRALGEAWRCPFHARGGQA